MFGSRDAVPVVTATYSSAYCDQHSTHLNKKPIGVSIDVSTVIKTEIPTYASINISIDIQTEIPTGITNGTLTYQRNTD